jgi:hypothetical protein
MKNTIWIPLFISACGLWFLYVAGWKGLLIGTGIGIAVSLLTLLTKKFEI